jgi:hypothetical protein
MGKKQKEKRKKESLIRSTSTRRNDQTIESRTKKEERKEERKKGRKRSTYIFKQNKTKKKN